MTHCNQRCRSKHHTYELNVAVQNGTYAQAKAYVATCHTATRGLDINGRSLLHVAAANGKHELITWLLEKGKGSLDTKDKESGWTALHRAIFYGQISCAVNLLKHGATLKFKDNESLTALDLCTRDRMYMPFVQTNKEIGVYDVCTWGDNSSYTLGHGKESHVTLPQVVDSFRRKQIAIKKVLMRRYHSVFLISDGAVYTCGHGRGGRLGLGHEEPTLHPMKVRFPASGGSGDSPSENKQAALRIVDIAAGQDHTLFLGANGKVYCCGRNDYNQCGIPSDSFRIIKEPRMATAAMLVKGPPITHISAAKFHSVVSSANCVYTFGVNAGQLGPSVEAKHIMPRLVSPLSNRSGCKIQLVECCETATVVVISGEKREGFYILYNHSTRYISFRGAKFDRRITRLCVSQGEHSHSIVPASQDKSSTSPTILWINAVGQLLLWTGGGGGLIRKVTYNALGRQLSVIDLSFSLSEILITTEEGGAYILTLSDTATSSFSKDSVRLPSAVPTVDLKIKRVPGVHRATQCSLDPQTNNYAVLQAQEYTCFFAEVDHSRISEEYNTLYTSADEMDGICDIVIKCGGERVPCHKYILASQSTYFKRRIKNLGTSLDHIAHQKDDEDIQSRFANEAPSVPELCVNSEINVIRFILSYIYTGSSDLRLISDPVHTSTNVITKSSSKSESKISAAKALEEAKLQNRLKEIARTFGLDSMSPTNLTRKISHTISKFTDWCDVVLMSSDELELRCHKCVLVARMEYFRTMLTGHWFEGQDRLVRLELPIPYDILYAVILYIYTDDSDHIKDQDVEFMVNVLVVADQLLLSRLKQICESLIVSHLTIDNVIQVYKLSSTYQTAQLKDAALFMICLNMAEILELSLLADLDIGLLEELTRYYRDKMRCMSRRFLGKISDGPSEEEMNRVMRGEDEEKETTPQYKRMKRRSRTSSNSSVASDSTKTTTEELKLDDVDFIEEFADSVTIDRSDKVEEVPRRVPLTLDAGPECEHAGKTRDNNRHPPSPVSPKSPPSCNELHSPISAPMDGRGDGQPSLRDIMYQEQKADTKHRPDALSKSKSKAAGRRKYRSLDENTLTELEKPKLSPTTASTTQPVWSAAAAPAAHALSFKELMEKEKSYHTHVQPPSTLRTETKHLKYKPQKQGASKPRSITSPVKDNKPAWNLPQSPTSPSNQNLGFITSPRQNGHHSNNIVTSPNSKLVKSSHSTDSSQPARNLNFQDIMSQEEMQTKELLRHTNKPLLNVQIEERAIEELLQMYTANKHPDERITVQRVTPTLATPQWRTQAGS